MDVLSFLVPSLLYKGFEARIAAQRIEQWIDFDPVDVGAVAFFETLFEPAKRLLFVIQAEVEQSSPVAEHLTALTYVIEIAQHSQRGVFVTSVRFGLSPERRHKWVVAQLLCLFVFDNR